MLSHNVGYTKYACFLHLDKPNKEYSSIVADIPCKKNFQRKRYLKIKMLTIENELLELTNTIKNSDVTTIR